MRERSRENLKWGNPNASDEELLAALETAQARELVEQKEGGLKLRYAGAGRKKSFRRSATAPDDCKGTGEEAADSDFG